MSAEVSIGAYLIQQLSAHGIRHVFGVPGDYSLVFLKALEQSPITFINTSDEAGAGIAADGYARQAGLGAVCITYAVGSLKVANAVAQAYAERSPVVVICGAPGVLERRQHPLLHHRVNHFDTQLDIFRQLTVAATALNNPETACAEIDRVLHAAERHKRPVYIELPRDMVPIPASTTHTHRDEPEASNASALAEALQEAGEMLTAARQPVILAGVELKRFGLHADLARFAETYALPIASTIQSKSVVREDSPLYIGLYAGAVGSEETRRYVESSDCVLLLGSLDSDINMGMFTANLDRARLIAANTDGVTIRHHAFDVRMGHFLDGLLGLTLPERSAEAWPGIDPPGPFLAQSGEPVTIARLIHSLHEFLDDDTVVVADIGDALFSALEMHICCARQFCCAPYYSSMGFAIPASLGMQAANPGLRPLVLVGDGAFQMSGMELSTAARYNLSPIIIIFNNDGYATERFFLDGAFNDIHPWNYSRIPEIFGMGKGYAITTEDELTNALADAREHPDTFAILDVRLRRDDVSIFLQRLGERFGKSVRG